MIVTYKAQIENSEEASHTEEVWVDTGEVDEDGNPIYEIEEVTVTDELGGWVEEQITDFSVENLAAYEQDGFTAVAVDDEGAETDVQWTEVEEPADPYEQVELDIAGIAAAGNQHFWHNSEGAAEYGGTGAHVTDTDKDAWVEAVADGFSDLSDEKPYHNLLMNSLGILLRSALNTLVSISKTAIAFFDGLGNDTANVVASFGKDGAQIGRSNETHVSIDYHSMQMFSKDNARYLHISDLRGKDGYVTVEFDGTLTSAYNTLAFITDFLAEDVVTLLVDGHEPDSFNKIDFPLEDIDYTLLTIPNVSNGEHTVTCVYRSSSVKAKAFTLGERDPESNIAPYSHAVGYYVAATGRNSYAGGVRTTASGQMSHAIGYKTIAAGNQSFAAGNKCEAAGDQAFVHGYEAKATKFNSVAFGNRSLAAAFNQFVIGQWNAEDPYTPLKPDGNYAFIIGNGSSESNRSNALAVKWDGTIVSNNKAGITQTVAIGGKTLTITGGIITGIS